MWRKLALTASFALPAILLRLSGTEVPPGPTVLVFGAGVVASAVLLSWAAEAAQVDISGSLAIAILALIAVLPEYAVDLYFAFTAGSNPEYTQFAAANMTGSNRLLIGIGWPLVVFVGFAAMRRARQRSGAAEDAGVGDRQAGSIPGALSYGVILPARNRVELAFLAIASAYAFLIPMTRSIAWYDALVLLAIFGAYLWRVTREGRSEPELIGVAADIAELPRRQRRPLVAGLFLLAAAVVVMAAEPFANGLVASGKVLGIDQFLLVQWLAPLSSEAPELIVASIFAWRLHAAEGLGMLLSSKVNQWTLLVGSLWVAYTLGGGGGGALPLDDRQIEEFLLTSAQALLAFAVLADLRFGLWEAAAVFGLFVLQFPFPNTEVRLIFAVTYIVVAAALLVHRRKYLPAILASVGRWDAAPEAASDRGRRDASCTRPLRSTPGSSVGPFLAGLGGVALADLLVDGRMTSLGGQQDLAGGYLRLTPSTNDGIAFGLLRDTGPLPILLAIVALAVLARFAWAMRDSRSTTLALGLLAGGAVANVLERLRMGTVLDYLDLGIGATRWPTFNVADVGISLAVVILVLATVVRGKRGPRSSAPLA